MYVNINEKWHRVAWTDPDYISIHGEQLHKTRCGLLKIRVSYATIGYLHQTCGRCEKLVEKDKPNGIQDYVYEDEGLGGT